MRAYSSTTYENSHESFVKAYRLVNEYVTSLYLVPKKLVDDAGDVLDSYYIATNAPDAIFKTTRSCRAIIDFMNQLDEFTDQTVTLFTEHRNHVNATREYMRKVSTMQLYKPGKSIALSSNHKEELTPELNKLIKGLKDIKLKADRMIDKLEKLEMRWETMKNKI